MDPSPRVDPVLRVFAQLPDSPYNGPAGSGLGVFINGHGHFTRCQWRTRYWVKGKKNTRCGIRSQTFGIKVNTG